MPTPSYTYANVLKPSGVNVVIVFNHYVRMHNVMKQNETQKYLNR